MPSPEMKLVEVVRVQRRSFLEKISEGLQSPIGGTDPTLVKTLLEPRSRVSTLINSKKREKVDSLIWSRLMEGQSSHKRRGPTSVNVGGGATQRRCIPIWWLEAVRLAVIITQRMGFPVVVGVQWIGNRPITACTYCLSDDLNIKATHLLQIYNDKKVVDEDQTDGCRYSAPK